MILDRTPLEEIFSSSPWLVSMPTDRRRKLLQAAKLRHYRSGERVYSIGDAGDGLYGVVSGCVRFVNFPFDGCELVNAIFGQGAWFGALSLLDDGPRPHDVIAVSDTVLAKISRPSWRALVRDTPELFSDLVQLSCKGIRHALMEINMLMSGSSTARLAWQLLHGRRDKEGHLDFRQEDLADIVGVSRQSVNRLLRRFETDGLIARGYAKVKVLNPNGLAALLN